MIYNLSLRIIEKPCVFFGALMDGRLAWSQGVESDTKEELQSKTVIASPINAENIMLKMCNSSNKKSLPDAFSVTSDVTALAPHPSSNQDQDGTINDLIM